MKDRRPPEETRSSKFAVCLTENTRLESNPGPALPMRSIEELRLLAVWVNSDHMVGTALHLMRGHRLTSLGVVDAGKFKGVINQESILRAPENEQVGKWLEQPRLTIDAASDAKRAASQFIVEDIVIAPVLRGEQYVGMLTSNMLLDELSRSWDPLTNLPWSDQLREWGMDRLAEGREITILFLDIDDFGNYNKKYGHIVGDRILQSVASRLRHFLTGEWDVLVRFGGDEFAMGMVLDRDGAERLKLDVERALESVLLEGISEPVSVSVGLSGGKRSKERESIHFAATVDSLINLASKDCMRMKKLRGKEVPKDADASQDFQVVEVAVDEDGGPTVVLLTLDGQPYAASHYRDNETDLESVALATAEAIERTLDSDRIRIEDVVLTETPGARAVTVAGRIERDSRSVTFVRTRTVGEDVYLATAEATLEGYVWRAKQRRMDS